MIIYDYKKKKKNPKDYVSLVYQWYSSTLTWAKFINVKIQEQRKVSSQAKVK